jgi:DNA-binding response OmpR family regulator
MRRVLVVDDQLADRELLSERLGMAGFEVDTAVDGVDGWDKLRASASGYSVVLLDRRMPRLTGLELLKKMKEHEELKHVPAIFQTGAGERAEIQEGIEAGCYYYLVKPYDTEILVSIVRAAINDFTRYEAFRSEVRKGMRGLLTMREASFEFRTIKEAGELGTLLAYACPEPERQVVGLTELLINAVEHGNLGITYSDKTRLNAEGTWRQEVERRLELDEYKDRTVRVGFERDDSGVSIVIRDEGEGFDWTPYLQIDPKRAFDTHGRGIAMAKMLSLTKLEYRGCGNELLAYIATDG